MQDQIITSPSFKKQDTTIVVQGLHHDHSIMIINDNGMNEGIKKEDTIIFNVNRHEKITQTVEHIDKYHYIFIESPPDCGKTSFGQLLERHLIATKPGLNVQRISYSWDTQPPKSTDPHDYSDFDDFWKRSLMGSIYVAMFTTFIGRVSDMSLENYGSIDYDHTFMTFSNQEFKEIIDIFGSMHTQLPENIVTKMWKDTAGHVGLVTGLLNQFVRDATIGQVMKSVLTGIATRDDLERAIYSYLTSQECADFVASSNASPSRPECFVLPNITGITKQLEFIDQVIEARITGSLCHYGVSAEYLINQGYLARTKLDFYDYNDSSTIDFVSPLYYREYFRWRVAQEKKNKEEEYTDTNTIIPLDPKHQESLIQLVIESIKHFKPNRIRSFKDRYQLEKDYVLRPLEDVWQTQFYYASIGPLSHCNVSANNLGKRFNCESKDIDFYIGGLNQWALDIVCSNGDDKQLEEHLDRFKVEGFHNNLLPIIKEWFVVDFISMENYNNKITQPIITHDNL
ncbi:hypothetical protein DFA_07564 [Cavenderia fasciculata]|uniref:Uncharacterized protein n=1 Tax=Cavenderia fasciculata TaxID=261658 RepID=F4PWS6_CACFS|nr:uncharacterized protein DFA_07564 [Cavenderia fasciculata]EGG20440.1 hypothetical protein DFA_07564 [Cavenderia fasciculata]|eukprot:XP_004367423.1 hypothetical protein DFA_07564 [Cavenderia fasciculata]